MTTVDFSNPELYNKKYIPLLHNRKRYIFMLGGRGSGKSRFQAQKEIIESYERGNRLLAVRKVERTIKDSMFAELCAVISIWGLNDDFIITASPMRITNRLTGSDMMFRGMDDPMKIKSVSGVSRVWFEEALELTEEDFDTVDLSVRGMKNMQITCTLNPGKKKHWINRQYWSKGNTDRVELLHTTYLDNKWVGPEYARVLEALKEKSEDAYKKHALGLWTDALQGLVYKYEEIPNIPEDAKRMGYGLDFGFNHPACLVGCYEWNDAIVLDEEFHRSGMINGDIVTYLDENYVRKTDYIVADNSRPEAIKEIQNSGFNCVPCIKGPDSVKTGIDIMKGKKIYITSRSVGIKDDFDNYVWAKDSNGQALEVPIKLFDDGPDASRYIYTYFHSNGTDEDEITFVGRKNR